MILLGLVGCATSGEQLATEVLVRNPLGSIDRDVDPTEVHVGVAERVDAGSYMYLRTDEPTPRWFVGLSKPVHVGARVWIAPMGVAHDFHSARTGMRFEALWFGVVRSAG